MPDASTVLSLPYIQPAQAQKHVTHNEAMRKLDAIVQLGVLSDDAVAPPAEPQAGDRHLVPDAAEGEWTGQDGSVALWSGGYWEFYRPLRGWLAFVLATGALVAYDGTGWRDVGDGLSAEDLQNLAGIGVTTTSDTVNRLAVAGAATLLSHEGAGHRLKLNKAGAEDTASLVYQTDFSGRAEMGIVGADDFQIKVSADGAGWTTAMAVEAASGRVSFPAGGVRELLTANRTYYVDPALGDDTGTGLAPGSSAFASIARAIDAVMRIDAGGRAVRIELAPGSYAVEATLGVFGRVLGASSFEIAGAGAAPSEVVLTGSTQLFQFSDAVLRLSGMRLECPGVNEPLITAIDGSRIEFGAIDFGATQSFHLRLYNSSARAISNYTISGSARGHLTLNDGAQYQQANIDVALLGTPNFDAHFIACLDLSAAVMFNPNFIGAATGKRHLVRRYSILNTFGEPETALPGDISGSESHGGLYI